VLDAIGDVPALLAHVNDCSDDDLGRLTRSSASVVFCPRAHAYFGHEKVLGRHRWQEMLAAGVNVCLGTDSIINLPMEECDRLSTLDDARLLYRRERVQAAPLMQMITVNGAMALGLDPQGFEWPSVGGTGTVAGVAAVRVAGDHRAGTPLDWVMGGRGAPVLLAGGRQ
jgi:cytosine/adenosine deaminase-related metal-dependent hydrolase